MGGWAFNTNNLALRTALRCGRQLWIVKKKKPPSRSWGAFPSVYLLDRRDNIFVGFIQHGLDLWM
jgi:hypothetical protein